MTLRLTLLLAASAGLLLTACSKEIVRPDAQANAPPPPSASPAAAAASDPDNFPKVDPATLTDASSVADVHNALIRPGYQKLNDAEMTAPTTDAGWKAATDGAEMVMKGAGLLTKGSRPKDQDEWVKFANAVVEKTKASAALIAAKKADDLVMTDGDIQDACTSCHKKYRG